MNVAKYFSELQIAPFFTLHVIHSWKKIIVILLHFTLFKDIWHSYNFYSIRISVLRDKTKIWKKINRNKDVKNLHFA